MGAPVNEPDDTGPWMVRRVRWARQAQQYAARIGARLVSARAAELRTGAPDVERAVLLC